jgi:hypothetical protein
MISWLSERTACSLLRRPQPTLHAKLPRKACGEAGESSSPQPMVAFELFTLCQAHMPPAFREPSYVPLRPEEAAPPARV